MTEHEPGYPQGRAIKVDPEAVSSEPKHPPFISPPTGAPVYYGFLVLEDSRTEDGWCFGTISDYDVPEGRNWGDAFVIAPDDMRAGIVWEAREGKMTLEIPPDERRWGVYGLAFPQAIHNREKLIEQLHRWLPQLKEKYAEWQMHYASVVETIQRALDADTTITQSTEEIASQTFSWWNSLARRGMDYADVEAKALELAEKLSRRFGRNPEDYMLLTREIAKLTESK